MNDRFVIISAGDASFFDLAQGCVQSVRDKPEGARIPFAFLDLGCTQQQRAWLQDHVDFLLAPQWDFDFPGRDQAAGHLRGLLARPFLKNYFPDFDLYVWLDADTWVHSWRGVELFLEGARGRRGLAISPELDRGNLQQYGRLPRYWGWAYKRYREIVEEEIASTLCSFPMLNAGVFALHREARHWSAWEKALGDALQKNCSNVTDQLMLNMIVYRGGLFNETELLPAWCNWVCHAGLPGWDEEGQRLVEPYLPHTEIGILHLTQIKYANQTLRTTQGNKIEVQLRYPCSPVTTPEDQDS